jgi:hypothetical protein
LGSSSVTPPSSIPTPTASAAGTPVVVNVPQAPAVIILLPRGTPVEARVVAPPPVEGGLTTLQAVVDGATVEINARLPVALAAGVNVSLRVAPTHVGDAVTFRMGAVAAAAPEAVGTGQGASAETARLAALQSVSTIGVGKPIAALVLRGDVIPDHQQGAEVLEPGTRMTLRVTRIVLPETRAAAPFGTPPSAVASGSPAAPHPATLPVAPPQGQAAARYAAIGRIGGMIPAAPEPAAASPTASPATPGMRPSAPGAVSAAMPGTPQPTPSSAHAAQPAALSPAAPASLPGAPATPAMAALSGMVVGRSALGQPTLKTESGFIALDVRAALPVGTEVAVEVLSRLPPQPGAMPPAAFSGASPWTTLDALVQAIASVDPEAAARITAQLPQAGPQMLANLAGAMAALRTGEAGGWLRLSEALQRTREDPRAAKLAARLADDMHDAATGTRRAAGEWRVYPLPMFSGGQIERIQMLVRRAPEPDEDTPQARRARGDDTRFLLDFTLSHLGPMQVDGLVSASARVLDLVVRTHAEMPSPMPEDLRGIFATAMAAVGYAGTLSLKTTPEFVVPQAVHPVDDRPGVVV